MTNINFSIKDTFVLSKTRQKTLKDLRFFLLDLMLAVEGHAKRYAPVDTGRLRSSIITSPKYPADKIIVADGVKYGIHQEFGTTKMKAQPFMRPALNTALKVDLPILAKKHKLK